MGTLLATSPYTALPLAGRRAKLVPDALRPRVALLPPQLSAARDLPTFLEFQFFFDRRAVHLIYGPDALGVDEVTR